MHGKYPKVLEESHQETLSMSFSLHGNIAWGYDFTNLIAVHNILII